jgi:hypothetical protein
MGEVAIASKESLEDFYLIVETKLSAALQAELSTIKGDIAELKQFVQEVREMATMLQELAANHPLGAMLAGGAPFPGSGFGFQ